jgi:cytosol alanyl aminopeptidase
VTRAAVARFEPWLTNHAASGLTDDLVGIVLSTAAREGDAKRFDQLLEAARHARDRTERRRLIGALGNFLAPALAKRALDLVTGTEFDLRESLSIVYTQLSQRETRQAAWTWLEANLDSLLARMRSDEAAGFLGFVGGAFCDAPHRGQAEALLVPRAKAIDGAAMSVARGLEDADQCIANHARLWPALQKFLASMKEPTVKSR